MTTVNIQKNGGISKVSASNNSYPKRAAFEFYPTPLEATRALLSVETFEDSIWEPACGDFEKHFYTKGVESGRSLQVNSRSRRRKEGDIRFPIRILHFATKLGTAVDQSRLLIVRI